MSSLKDSSQKEGALLKLFNENRPDPGVCLWRKLDSPEDEWKTFDSGWEGNEDVVLFVRRAEGKAQFLQRMLNEMNKREENKSDSYKSL